jgi:hypothetical protein
MSLLIFEAKVLLTHYFDKCQPNIYYLARGTSFFRKSSIRGVPTPRSRLRGPHPEYCAYWVHGAALEAILEAIKDGPGLNRDLQTARPDLGSPRECNQTQRYRRGDRQTVRTARRRIVMTDVNTVLRNLQNERWFPLAQEAGFTSQSPKRHRGSAFGDLNHDGKVDLVVTAIGAPAETWMNDTPNGSHWLELALQAGKSNRDGIGTRIRAGGRRTCSVQLREHSIRIRVIQCWAGSLWAGSSEGGGRSRNSLALRQGTDTEECACGSSAPSNGADLIWPCKVEARPFSRCYWARVTEANCDQHF